MAKKLCSDYLPVASKVASFILRNIPATSEPGIWKDIQVLCNLTGTTLSAIQTEIGGLYLLFMSNMHKKA